MTMKRFLYLIIICALGTTARAQHVFKGTSLSKALIELDQSTKRYDISFVYDELEDFTVTKTIKRGQSVPWTQRAGVAQPRADGDNDWRAGDDSRQRSGPLYAQRPYHGDGRRGYPTEAMDHAL